MAHSRQTCGSRGATARHSVKRLVRRDADSATAYARSVATGKTQACKWVRLACERHLRDLKSRLWKWDVAASEKAISFLRLLRHYKGEFAGRPFEPEPFECFIVGSIFGWKLPSGLRRFRYALLVIPRKNGKTFLIAGIGLLLLCADGEAAAEVYSVATKEDQAKLPWNDAKHMIRVSPGFGDVLRRTVSEIRYEDNASIWKPLGADSETLDGLNPHGGLFDELHAWKDRRLWDIIDSALGARRQPLIVQISTEGDVREGIFDEQVALVQALLEDRALADGAAANYFGVIYTLDEGDDPFDERAWHKANPLLGRGKSVEYMRDQAAKARLSPAKLRDFLMKQLNVRPDKTVGAWLSMDAWNACAPKRLTCEGAMQRLHGRTVSMGLDLARVNDLSALAISAPADGGVIDIAWRFWLPAEGLRERCLRDKAPYDEWARNGWLKLTDGNVTDFRVIEDDIAELAKEMSVSALHYDPHAAHDLAMRLRDNHGVPVVQFGQTFTNYALPMREFDRLVAAGRLNHGGNPIATRNARNTRVRVGPSGNMMPDKIKSTGRIDGIPAAVMSIAPFVTLEEQDKPAELGMVFS